MKDKKKYTNCDKVYKDLQKYFSKETYDTGERVPAERTIAEELKVNRTTLRAALQRMVKEGMLERKVGVGTFFRISPKEMSENYTKINTKCSTIELLETRIIFEPQIANIAAFNIKSEDIKQLRNLCRIKTDITLIELEKADIMFHDTLAKLSCNMILNEIYSVISSMRKKILNAKAEEEQLNNCGFECTLKWKEMQEDIISALEKKNNSMAQEAVRKKLNCILGQYSLLH